MFIRYALVSARPESIAAYLPDNYRVIGSVDGETVIGGRDVAGWTLDAYVIPRLASGLYFATEIDLSHPSVETAAGLVADSAGAHPADEQLVDAPQPITICQLDQRLGARGPRRRAREHRHRRERELRIDKRQLLLQSQTAAPPRRGARERLGLTVQQRQQDRQRVLQADRARKLGHKRANLRRRTPIVRKGAL